jgi:integrase
MAKNYVTVKELKSFEPGEHFLGNGLAMRVSPKGKRVWFFRFTWEGKRQKLTLGAFPELSLADAGELARKCSNWLAGGLHPKHELNAERLEDSATAVAESTALTFGEFVTEQLPIVTEEFDNEKHRQQWFSTFRTYCSDKPIWTMPLEDVDQNHVAECIRPIWREKHETANRLRGRIKTMFDIAKAEKHYHHDNPASPELQKFILPRLTKAEREGGHHTALEYQSLPRFWADLMAREDGPARDCLAMCILTALRTSEIREGQWHEIDLEKREWSIPGPRMKTRVPHVIPITDEMEQILMRQPTREGYIFRNPMKGNCLSNMAMLSLLKRMGEKAFNKDGDKITVHGFRSTFTDWLGDCTQYDELLAEYQVAHKIPGSKRHYRRSTALNKRHEVMAAYSDYATGKVQMERLPTNVFAL